MKQLSSILGCLLVLFFIVNVNAQVDIQGTMRSIFIDTFGFPKEWLNTKDMIFYGFIPFLGIWLITYGLLDRIRIFRRKKLNGFLSFLIAFSTLPMRLFILIVATLFAIMGVYSVALFAIIFITCTFLYSGGKVWGWKRDYGHYDMVVTEVDKEIDFLRQRVAKIEQLINKIKNSQHYNPNNIKTASELEDLESEKIKWKQRILLLELKKKHIHGEKKAAKTFDKLEENL